MEPPREKYNSVRNFLDNLGNEKVKICRNCNAVFSYTYETTVLCLSCDFEEEVSTLPSVVEIEDEFEVVEAAPAVIDPSPVAVDAVPVAADLDIVESKNEWDIEMDSFEPAKEISAEASIAETVTVEDTEEVITETEAEEVVAESITVENTEEVIMETEAEEVVTEAVVAEAAETKEAVVAEAEGEVERFNQLLAEYQKAPDVTRDRLYLDALQSVLSNSTKVMVDVEGGNNLLYLPLDKIMEEIKKKGDDYE